jgi:hypothetical protein
VSVVYYNGFLFETVRFSFTLPMGDLPQDNQPRAGMKMPSKPFRTVSTPTPHKGWSIPLRRENFRPEQAEREEQLVQVLQTKTAEIPPEAIAKEVIELTDQEEEEIDEAPPTEDAKTLRDRKKAEVAQEMVTSMTKAVMQGLCQSDARVAKVWAQHMLLETAEAVVSAADVDSKQKVREAIVQAWMDKKHVHECNALAYDRQFRMYSEIGRWLASSGWAQDAVRYQRRALRRQNLLIRAQEYARIWEQTMQAIARDAF